MNDGVKVPQDATAAVELSDGFRMAHGYRPLDRFTVAVEGHDPVDREVLRGGRAVVVIAVDLARDSLVMVRQFRLGAHLATGAGDLVEFVAGRLEKGEDVADAARREALEEIGVEIGRPVAVFRFLSSPGSTDEYATVFVAGADSSVLPKTGGLAIEHEATRPFAVSIDAALAALQKGSVHSGYTIIGLQWLALNRGRLPDLLATSPATG